MQLEIAHKEVFPVCQELQKRIGFSGVNPDHIHTVLPLYKRHILNAVEQSDGEFAWGDIVERLDDARWQMWITPRSCLITSIREMGQYSVCTLIYMGGTLDDAQECLAGVAEWARVNGCEKMHIEGRKGWGRVFADFGARLKYHVYSFDLGD